MRTIEVKQLTVECFARYGSFADMLHPRGDKIGPPEAEFFPDGVRAFPCAAMTGFSTVKTSYRPMVIDEAERHSYAAELLLPLDGDVVCFAAPAPFDTFPAEKAEAFLVPRGTLLKLRPGVWHKAPFPVGPGSVSTLVVLPERTYATDCLVEKLTEEKRLSIRVP